VQIPFGEHVRDEKNSDDKSYYYALVDEYLSSGQTGRALIQAAKNIAYHENDPVAYINRARVYEKLGALENAILDLEEALRLAPDDENTRFYLEMIRKRIAVKN